jgi:Alr-MurF fusion protein
VTQRESRIATIPVGYADGFRRSPSWREVLIHGRRAPVVGRVAMDYAMLDVTDIPGVRAGDEVVLIGRQGEDQISAEEVADWLGTINYEVIAVILPRVPRVV